MTEKNNKWSELANRMIDLKDHYIKLHEILLKKENELIKGNTKKLNEIIKEESSFVKQIERAEARRITASFDCIPGKKPPTLEEIINAAPEEEREGLEKSAISLIEALNLVVVSNNSVAELVKESISFVNFQINLYASNPSQENIYEGSGKIKSTDPGVRGIINREA